MKRRRFLSTVLAGVSPAVEAGRHLGRRNGRRRRLAGRTAPPRPRGRGAPCPGRAGPNPEDRPLELAEIRDHFGRSSRPMSSPSGKGRASHGNTGGISGRTEDGSPGHYRQGSVLPGARPLAVLFLYIISAATHVISRRAARDGGPGQTAFSPTAIGGRSMPRLDDEAGSSISTRISTFLGRRVFQGEGDESPGVWPCARYVANDTSFPRADQGQGQDLLEPGISGWDLGALSIL